MNALAEKLHLLEQSAPNPATLSLLVDKLLLNQAEQYRQKIAEYNQSIVLFEDKFGWPSELFLQQFASGSLGDDMDFFEWEGLLMLRKMAIAKLDLLEQSGV